MIGDHQHGAVGGQQLGRAEPDLADGAMADDRPSRLQQALVLVERVRVEQDVGAASHE